MTSWLQTLTSWREKLRISLTTAAEAAAAAEKRPASGSQVLQLVQRPEAQQVFDILQDNLMIRWQETAVRMVTVCATVPGEGATTVALGLALAAARDPQERILLVDGNFHQPNLGRAWQLQESPGLSHYVTGQASLEAVVQATSLANLWVMVSGRDSGSHAKLLDTNFLNQYLAPLTTRFSLVIIDSPAVSNYPEAPVYAHFSDRVLLVVAAGRSRAPVVQFAVGKFPLSLRERIEVVLNRRTYPIPRFIYDRLWSY